MTGPSWLVDSKRIASKIRNATEGVDLNKVRWKTNPSKACPRCNFVIDNSDVVHEWPGLPKGVKFDPSDQELLLHLIAKVGKGDSSAHPFIDEFIPTVDEENGICYTHPQKLPGVKQDGTVAHFFHRTFKAYNIGTRKRRKINNDDCDIRWHKTGKTKPVIIDGIHVGCKKIMVLYISTSKGERPEKTNWVIHQYHLGTGEDEREGEFVISKIFYQQPKPGCKMGEDLLPEPVEVEEAVNIVVPSSFPEEEAVNFTDPLSVSTLTASANLVAQHHTPNHPQRSCQEKLCDQSVDEENCAVTELDRVGDQDNLHTDDTKWWEGESQFLLDSQQLAEGLAICEEFLLSQTSSGGDETKKDKPQLLVYPQIGVEDLRKELEEYQKQSSSDRMNIELDTQPDMRLSQLEFGSQDSFPP